MTRCGIKMSCVLESSCEARVKFYLHPCFCSRLRLHIAAVMCVTSAMNNTLVVSIKEATLEGEPKINSSSLHKFPFSCR